MGGASTRARVNARAVKLQAMAIIAGGAIKLPTENARKGLLRDITQIHRDIKNRALGGAQLDGGQQQAALTNVIAKRLMRHRAEHPLQVPL